MTDALFDLPPPAHAALRDLANAATVPVKALVSGGIGTGKTTILSAARNALREGGLTVLAGAPQDGDPSDAALVVDDLHLLSDTDLQRLTDRVANPRTTVVAATQAREQRPALRTLMTALERERPRIALGAVPVDEHLLACTAGLPFLVAAASRSGQSPEQAAKFALMERLRRFDESDLDTLLILSLTVGLGSSDVAGAQQLSTTEARELVDRARASGVVEPSHPAAFLALVHDAVALLVGNAHHHQTETSLLRSQLETAGVSADFALRLAEHGLRDDRLAAILARQAAATEGDPIRSARLYRAAVQAGAEGVTAQLADTLARTGDCGGAAALADELLTSPDSTERAAGVRIAASVAAHDGNAGQAAELFGWLGPHPDAVISAAAAVALAATGDLAAARAALSLQDTGPPTSAARVSRNLADGLLTTMDQPYQAAMAKLGQALATEHSLTQITPDSPAALVTLAALHGGDPVRARSVIGRALRTGQNALFERRHLLLSGWIKMQEGQLTSAAADVAAAGSGTGLHRRDALWAAALQTAIARRNGDAGALQKHWLAAMEVLAEYSIDLFALLPLGELWVAAARMRQVEQLRHALDQAFMLLNSLGNPPLWSISLHWSGVHAGILSSSPESVAPHGQALSSAATQSELAQVLSGAGRTWLRVLADQVNVDEVTVAARSLSRVGLTSDATRLAGQAALQTPDARVSGAMLQLARDLKLGTGAGETSSEAPLIDSVEPTTGRIRPPAEPPAGSPLSDREREVAELLLLGLPYRDIGGQLFISAKTVEHHVARIRRRLGAGSRSEMLSMLRAMLAQQA
ncbi:LuxR family transcriptional regulator [Mycobacterium kubicae]|uniref:isoniazid response ATPase/transcriptional regulator IniR n=1 Tax=Mycobacterium kubicae TaxID=120959 RepID=UPI001641AF28|nr:isoniazid response ATPase/transcriptional regulator IniR [Mycobacterium kubicae]QNI05383.1 LuxR family transcriptional regulator [Mycobacterium kubicae]